MKYKIKTRFYLVKEKLKMRTVLLGKEIVNKYHIEKNLKEKLEEDGTIKYIYTAKPEIKKDVEIIYNPEICSFEGKHCYNSKNSLFLFDKNEINISETETVKIEKEIFRADLNEMHLYTDKIVSEVDDGKYDTELDYETEIRKFNCEMIESNEQLKLYCDLHHLDYSTTDVVELFKFVFPNKKCVIKDGIIREETQKEITFKSDLNDVFKCIDQEFKYD